MDQENNQPLKLYYSIREVSEALDLNPSLLRYWETEFPMLQPKKNRKGNRMYTEKDLELLRQIRHLLKERKFTIKGALTHLSDKGQGGNLNHPRTATQPQSRFDGTQKDPGSGNSLRKASTFSTISRDPKTTGVLW